mmetsp:Transcript_2418/g.3655  ORF Transcript_2418/g.3655 Transcript_2418/m.3655 type:complete len:209 (-) Transcript_2418:471-1097(-)
MDASFGRTSLPSLLSLSFTRCFSEVMSSKYHISISPRGPGTSIGLTISPPLLRVCSILNFSDHLISSRAPTTLASQLPSGPLFSSSTSLGLSVRVLIRSFSDVRMLLRNETAAFSRDASGPPSPAFKSMGRTRSPSDEAMRRARRPSSSITRESHSTSVFSARPSGPILSSAASMGLTYAASSPIIRAKLSSTRLSASVLFKKSDLQE